MNAAHIRLLCWDGHVQLVPEAVLRQLKTAPVCTAPGPEKSICGAAIWAVEHKGAPRRYVGRPPLPYGSWVSWADCTPECTHNEMEVH